MKIKKIVVVMAIATLILAMAVATASATSDLKNEKKDTGITFESKEKKVSSYKIIWNANGGKIGSKKTKVTTVKRGSKIGKLPTTPKRSGYTFKGWYTKKTGGNKITKNIKPTKSVTYFAKWTKTTSASKLVGKWKLVSGGVEGEWTYSYLRYYYFYADGRFQYFVSTGTMKKIEGKYSVSNGKVYFKERINYSQLSMVDMEENQVKFGTNYPKYQFEVHDKLDDMTAEYQLGSDKEGNYLKITEQRYDLPNYTLSSASKFRKFS